MLFDLNSTPRRRRVVQVVFGGLALLFAVGFVFFGVGGEVPGFLGGGDSGGGDPAFDDRIADAEAAVAENPRDTDALAELAVANAQAASSALDTDPETGATLVTQEAEDYFDDSIGAWEDYLALDPNKPDDAAASQILNVYILSIQAGSSLTALEIQELLEGAVQTATIFSDAQPSANTYGTLAQLAYFAGDTKQGDAAAANAIEESDASERKTTERLMEQFAKAGEQFQKSLAEAEKAQKTDPEQTFAPPEGFGDSGLGGLGTGGLAPTAPAP